MALSEIGELRKNRYDRGLWLTIRGRESLNPLDDVPDDALSAVSEALIEPRRLAK